MTANSVTGIIKSIFSPRDGSRERVLAEVNASRAMVDREASKFEKTIQELLNRNDVLTGRTKRTERKPHERKRP